MKKRGQAFLISSIVIIMVIVAFVTIANYSKKTTFSTFPYIAEEIQIESEKVMDYALVTSIDVINDFTEDVSEYVEDEEIEIYFITGDQTIECYNINEKPCEVKKTDKITVTIDGTDYFFTKTEGKHFYFIMIKEIRGDRGEKYVYTNA